MQKLLKGSRYSKNEGDFVVTKDAVSLTIFSSWGGANVTTVTFNYILVIVSLFPLNVGVSPCFHHTVVLIYLKMCQSGVDERVHTKSLTYRQSTLCFYMMGLGANFKMIQCQQLC